MPTDRYRFLGRAADRTKHPVLAEVPGARVVNGVATMRLYDPIDSWGGPWGTSAKEFVAALDELPDGITEIHLLINSPGGDVFEGIAILNALRRHSARVVTVVEGLAASAASLVAMAGDEVVMARNAELMVHDAWSICVGNAEDMAAMAENLGRISDNLASVYAAKTGGEVAAWREIMRAEAWYSADEAVAAGLADRLDEGADGAQAKAQFDLSVFKHGGRAAAPPPPSAAIADEPPQQVTTETVDQLLAALHTSVPQPSTAPAAESVATGDTPQELSPLAAARRAELAFIETASDAA